MTNHKPPAYRYVAIKGQMQRVANDHERQVKKAWVDRVLNVLDSDNLIAKAAAGLATDKSLIVECNVAALVWDDPRIISRLRQLEGSGVMVELVEHQHEVAGKTFERTRILVSFET